jgi:hypothetical protein
VCISNGDGAVQLQEEDEETAYMCWRCSAAGAWPGAGRRGLLSGGGAPGALAAVGWRPWGLQQAPDRADDGLLELVSGNSYGRGQLMRQGRGALLASCGAVRR